jgi:hypothetical protein
MRGGGIRKRQREFPPLTLTLSPRAGRGDELRYSPGSHRRRDGDYPMSVR